MTTATATEPVNYADAIEGMLGERYERLSIDLVAPSRTNPRKHFDDEYIKQLAVSVGEKGVIEPLLVRQVDAGSHKPMKFEIVAGECRYRASKLAGLKHLPCLIRLLTDEQALEHQLIENLHRKDLTPLEEAAGFRALIKANPDKHSAATIAERIGKSPSWVWDLMKLLDLIPEARQLLEEGRISVGHAIPIARLKPEDQKRVIHPGNGGLFEDENADLFETAAEEKAAGKYGGYKTRTIRELQDWIGHHIRFDVEHAAKAAPLEFEPVAAKVQEAQAQPGRGKKVVPITFDFNAQSEAAKDSSERTYGSQSWKRADGQEKSKTCDYAVLGVVVAGDRKYGQTFDVCVARDKCLVHWGDVVKARQKAAKLRESGQGKQAARTEAKASEREEAKRQAEEAAEDRAQKVWRASVADLDDAVVAKAKTLPIGKVIERVVRRSQFSAALNAICGKRAPRSADEALRVLLVDAIAGDTNSHWKYDREQSTRRLKEFGIDVAGILKKHEPPAVQTAGVKAKKGAKA